MKKVLITRKLIEENFKVKYVGEDFQIKPKIIDQNTIYIFGN